MVRVEIPSSCAARDLSPPVYFIVSRMSRCSTSANGVPSGKLRLLGAGAVASAIASGQSPRPMTSDVQSTAARSMTFSSSRTLPGHE